MFAPQTQYLPRTYTQQGQGRTTSKKNLDKENANALPSKTPSRLGEGGKHAIPSTSIRIGLGAKTGERDRNRTVGVEGVGDGKGKGRADEIGPKRLFASTSNTKSNLPPSKSLSQMPTIPSSSKTPAPRNKLPISTSQTLRTPAPPVRHILLATPLPSATRTRRRSKTSLTPVRQIQPGPEKEREREQEREEFQTPLPSAGRWEEEHSLDSITEGLDELGLGNGNEIQVLEGVEEGEEGSEGEIEYMPPKLAERPYEPPFDLPDIGPIFTKIATMRPMWGGWEGEKLVVKELVLEDVEEDTIRMRSDDELEEPMFRRRKPAKPVEVKAKPIPVQVNAVRPTATSRSGGAVSSKPNPTMSRTSAPAPRTMFLSRPPGVSRLSTVAPVAKSSSVPPGVRRPGLPSTRVAPTTKANRILPSVPIGSSKIGHHPDQVSPPKLKVQETVFDDPLLPTLVFEEAGLGQMILDLGLDDLDEGVVPVISE